MAKIVGRRRRTAPSLCVRLRFRRLNHRRSSLLQLLSASCFSILATRLVFSLRPARFAPLFKRFVCLCARCRLSRPVGALFQWLRSLLAKTRREASPNRDSRCRFRAGLVATVGPEQTRHHRPRSIRPDWAPTAHCNCETAGPCEACFAVAAAAVGPSH